MLIYFFLRLLNQNWDWGQVTVTGNLGETRGLMLNLPTEKNMVTNV